MVQNILERIDSPDLRVYAVWMPILLTDREVAARRSTGLIPDRRAAHFWSPDLELARAFRGPLGLERDPAWDVYLIYGRTATWPVDAVPIPDTFQHQLSGRLPDAALLDEASFEAAIRTRLHR